MILRMMSETSVSAFCCLVQDVTDKSDKTSSLYGQHDENITCTTLQGRSRPNE